MSEFTLAAFADEAGAEVSEQIRALQENGIPGIELRGVGEKNITDLTCEEAKELKKQLDDGGIRVWSTKKISRQAPPQRKRADTQRLSPWQIQNRR